MKIEFLKFNEWISHQSNYKELITRLKNIGIDLKIVKKPLQDSNTKPEDIEHNGEIWCVKTSGYREKFGGVERWIEYVESLKIKGCNVVYLYSIEALNQKICINNNDFADEVVYYVRADYKKIKTH